MFSLFKKKTREQQVIDKTEKVFVALINDAEFEFTDLETVQVMNNVRRRLNEHLRNKKQEFMEQSVTCNQKAIEIENAIGFIE